MKNVTLIALFVSLSAFSVANAHPNGGSGTSGGDGHGSTGKDPRAKSARGSGMGLRAAAGHGTNGRAFAIARETSSSGHGTNGRWDGGGIGRNNTAKNEGAIGNRGVEGT